MPIPQLTDRIKEAPAMVLRAIFAGVGQVLLAVDKLRAEVLDHGDQAGQPAGTAAKPAAPPPAPAARPAEAPAAAEPAAEEPSNVRMLREPGAAAAAKPAEAKPAAAKPAEAKPAAAKPAAAKPAAAKPAAAKPAAAKPAAAKAAAKPAAAKPAEAKPAAKAAAAKPAAAAAGPPPLANYDELTIASLRARLRGLDAASVQGLLDYEKSHANREAVVTMYERRLEKIASDAS